MEFYRRLRSELNTLLRVPDPYHLNAGVSAAPIGYTDGYRSVTGPYEHLNIGRQYFYDGTFYKSVTQGWMNEACPATPMEQHLPVIDLGYAQYLGQGMPSCYSCDRVYDGSDSKTLITHWIRWFKTHRALLTSDLIHILRPNSRDGDATVHVLRAAGTAGSPGVGKYRAVGHIFNPLPVLMTANLTNGLSQAPLQSLSPHQGGSVSMVEDGSKSSHRRTMHRERNLLRVPLYYAQLAAGTEVDVQWVESILADDGSRVDPVRAKASGLVGAPVRFTLTARAELMLPLPNIRPHSFMFFLVSVAGK